MALHVTTIFVPYILNARLKRDDSNNKNTFLIKCKDVFINIYFYCFYATQAIIQVKIMNDQWQHQKVSWLIWLTLEVPPSWMF